MNKSVSVRDFRENLARYLGMASQGGEVTITSHGKQIAKVVPPNRKKARAEIFGSMKDMVHIAPDFDETSDEIISAMEGGHEE